MAGEILLELPDPDDPDDPKGPGRFELRAGEVVQLVGRNGAGKTRLLRRLAALPAFDGIATPTAVGPRHPRSPSDATSATDAPVVDDKADAPATPHVAFLQQDPTDNLVGLTVAGEARLRGLPLPDALAPLANRASLRLSLGEARRVGLHLSGAGRILLLDEPMDALDADGRVLVHRCIAELVGEGPQQGAVVLVDPSGAAAHLVTRRVQLGATVASTNLHVAPPTTHGDTVLAFQPTTVVREGAQPIPLPRLRLGPGFHLLQGPNGCGKTTLLLACAGLLSPSLQRGSRTPPPAPATVRGKPAAPGVNLRILLQRAADHFHAATVAQQLAGADREAVAMLPGELLERHPLSLSGGEAQQVALVAVLGRDAAAYLLDEPEAHLDAAGLDLLGRLASRRVQAGACIVAASHDPRIAAAATSRVEWGAS